MGEGWEGVGGRLERDKTSGGRRRKGMEVKREFQRQHDVPLGDLDRRLERGKRRGDVKERRARAAGRCKLACRRG